MMATHRSNRNRSLRPALVPLEDRALLNATLPYKLDKAGVAAHVLDMKEHSVHDSMVKGPTITIVGKVSAGGFVFTNFDGPEHGHERRRRHQHERDLELGHVRRVRHR